MTAAVGARTASRRTGTQRRVLLPWMTAAAAAAGLALGPRAFGLFVVVLAAVAVAQGSAALSRPLVLPVVPAAALMALGLPVYAVLDHAAALARVPLFAAGMLILAFALLLVFGRRTRSTAAAAGTCLVGLLVGLGGTALVLLRATEGGLRWSAALLVLVALPDAAVAAAREARLAVSPATVRLVVAGALGLLLAVLSGGDPLSPLLVAILVVITQLALEGSSRLGDIVSPPTAPTAAVVRRRRAPVRRPGLGDVIGASMASAPAALLLAQAVGP